MAKREMIINELVKNPKYSSQWIGTAADILCEYEGTTVEFCEKYNFEQLGIIEKILEYNKKMPDRTMDLNIFANPELNATQMQIFLMTYDQTKGDIFDMIAPLAKPEYTYEKLNYICKGIINGVDLSDFINDYDPIQLSSILAGAEDGLDITLYNDPRIPGDIMNIMRHAISLGYKVDYNFDDEILAIDCIKE